MGERKELLPKNLPADTIAAVVGGGVTSDQVTNIWGLIRSALLLRDMTGSSLTGVYDPAMRAHAQGRTVPVGMDAVREQIARAIAPSEWRYWDGYNGKEGHELTADLHVAPSLAKADAILALRAPEAADAGAVAWRWHPKDMPGHGWTYTESKNRAKWCLLYEHPCEPLYASPTDAGIAAPPERVEISDEDMRDLLSSKDVGSGRAKLRRLMSLKSTAAPPAASADAVKEAVETEIERWETDKRTIYHDCEVLLSLDRIRAALPTAPVAGDDAGMRATLERISEIADGRDQLDGFPRANHERLRRLAEIKAFVIEALKDLPPATPCTPTSTERGGVS